MAAYRGCGEDGRPRSSLLREKRQVPPGVMPDVDEEVRFYQRKGVIERSSDHGGALNLNIRSLRAALRVWRRRHPSVEDNVRPLPVSDHVLRTTWLSLVLRHSVYDYAMRNIMARHHLEALLENDRRDRLAGRRKDGHRLSAEEEMRVRRLFEQSGLSDID